MAAASSRPLAQVVIGFTSPPSLVVAHRRSAAPLTLFEAVPPARPFSGTGTASHLAYSIPSYEAAGRAPMRRGSGRPGPATAVTSRAPTRSPHEAQTKSIWVVAPQDLWTSRNGGPSGAA